MCLRAVVGRPSTMLTLFFWCSDTLAEALASHVPALRAQHRAEQHDTTCSGPLSRSQTRRVMAQGRAARDRYGTRMIASSRMDGAAV